MNTEFRKQRSPVQAAVSSPEAAQATNRDVICSLFEGDYHLGLAVLINSLQKAGFKGLYWIGYRGSLPPWLDRLTLRTDGLYILGDALLGFESISEARHFALLKPDFMIQLFKRGIAQGNLWYFDPDITVRCQWRFFERWIAHGVCLCQESNMGAMPANHPLRMEWIGLARAAGWLEPLRQQVRYYNSGFVGLNIRHRQFLEVWSKADALKSEAAAGVDKLLPDTRARVFYTVDQDTMNIATMYSEEPLTTLGPEGMGWFPGGFTMFHSIGSMKPWRKEFLRSSLNGHAPSHADEHFLQCADEPLRPFSPVKLGWMRIAGKWASFIGRFNRRF